MMSFDNMFLTFFLFTMNCCVMFSKVVFSHKAACFTLPKTLQV